MNQSFYRNSIILIAIIILATTSYAKVPRRIVVEDHTGAWCQWCVRGNQASEELLEKYQESFIPVGIHNGDAMVTPYQAQIVAKIAIPGYPTGMINRMPVTVGSTTGIPVDPADWENLCDEHISDMSSVDVNVTYTIDKTAKTLTAKVTATMTDDYDGQLAFNLYIMQDSLTGSGSGWNQNNALSNNASYKDSPYYNLPSVLTGYYHKNVLIDMLGGAFGINGTFPVKALAGTTYEHNFTANLNNYPILQGLDRIWVVGLVQETGSKYEILNAKAAGKAYPTPRYSLLSSQSSVYLSGKKDVKTENQITFKNVFNEELNANIAIDTENSNIPSDWSVSLSSNTAIIAPNTTKTLTLNITPGSTDAFAIITVKSTVQATDTYNGASKTLSCGLLSDGIKYVIYHLNEGRTAPLAEAISGLADIKAKTAFIPLNTQSIAAYQNNDFDLLILPETYASYGALLNNGPALDFATSMMNKGKGVLITSVLDMFFVGGNVSSFIPDAATSTYFKDKLGISGVKETNPYAIGNPSAQTLSTAGITGIDAEISKDMAFNINEYNATSFPYYSFYADQISILNTTNVKPILNYAEPSLADAYKVAAVKIQTEKNRNIYMGFSFDLIANKVARTTLLGNMITWLLGSTDVEEFNNLNYSNINVYPNPVTNNSTVSFTTTNTVKSSDVYVLDINGNRVASLCSGSVDFGTQTLNLDASTLPSGKYYVITNLDGKYSMSPVVIQK